MLRDLHGMLIAKRCLDKVSWENPRNGGGDECFMPNDPALTRFFRRDKWEVAVPNCPSDCLGWALMHMKRCKVGKDEHEARTANLRLDRWNCMVTDLLLDIKECLLEKEKL